MAETDRVLRGPPECILVVKEMEMEMEMEIKKESGKRVGFNLYMGGTSRIVV